MSSARCSFNSIPPKSAAKDARFLAQIVDEFAPLFWELLVFPVHRPRLARDQPVVFDYTDLCSLACVTKQIRISLLTYSLEKRRDELALRRASERDLRAELAVFWKQQWSRLQTVTEENRRLRCLPTPFRETISGNESELECSAKEKKIEPALECPAKENPAPKSIIVRPKSILPDDAEVLLKAIAGMETSKIDRIAKKELVSLKAAFAAFFTSWSRAAEIAETVGQDELRGNMGSLAQVPATWNARSWAVSALATLQEPPTQKK